MLVRGYRYKTKVFSKPLFSGLFFRQAVHLFTVLDLFLSPRMIAGKRTVSTPGAAAPLVLPMPASRHGTSHIRRLQTLELVAARALRRRSRVNARLRRPQPRPNVALVRLTDGYRRLFLLVPRPGSVRPRFGEMWHRVPAGLGARLFESTPRAGCHVGTPFPGLQTLV